MEKLVEWIDPFFAFRFLGPNCHPSSVGTPSAHFFLFCLSLQSVQLAQFRRGRAETFGFPTFAVKPGESIFDQLLAEIAGVGLNEREETLHPASAHRILPTGANEKRPAQFFARVRFR